MKKKLFVLLFAMVMALSILPLQVSAAVTGLSGEGTAASPYLINNLAELEWFRDDVDAGNQYLGKYVKLTADIDLKGINWEPIGDKDIDKRAFQGTFDGDGHTISNLYIQQADSGLGFFAATSHFAEWNPPTYIKNLTFHNATVKSTVKNGHGGSYVGIVVANSRGWTFLDNVKVTGAIDVEGYAYVGGLVGHGYLRANNCHVNATGRIYANYWSVGGILGYGGEGSTKITNCSVSCTGTEPLNVHSVSGGAAAICGAAMDGTKAENVSAENIKVSANSDYYVGLILGIPNDITNATVKDTALVVNGKETQPKDISATINGKAYTTIKAALAAAVEGDTVQLMKGTFSEGTIAFPATLKNVTIKGAPNHGSILKNSTLASADGSSVSYEGITIDGIVFDNSNILMTGWRTGGASYKNWTVTNCEFKNIVRATNNPAAIHFNVDENEAVNGLTVTNNIINGVSGASNSGIYVNATGTVTIKDNIINNVAFRPYIVLLSTNDGIADALTVTGNTFSGSSAGRAQAKASGSSSTDTVVLAINENIFKGITSTQQICYWNFNDTKVTRDFSHNYYDIDIAANPGGIYYNASMTSGAALVELGIYPIYTELNADGTINKDSLLDTPVVKVGDSKYYNNFADGFAAAASGETITLLQDITLDTSYDLCAKGVSLAQNGKTVILTNGASLVSPTALTLKAGTGFTLVTTPTASGYTYTLVTTISSIAVTPNTVKAMRGEELKFDALINGEIANDAVIWTLSGNDYQTTTLVDGVLKVSDAETAATLTITASWRLDPSISATATVTVMERMNGQTGLNQNLLSVLAMRYNRTYEMKVVPAEGGTITASVEGPIRYNGKITYTFTADPGYVLENIFVDGKAVGAADTYTLTKVRAKHLITATFVPVTPAN